MLGDIQHTKKPYRLVLGPRSGDVIVYLFVVSITRAILN